jgi:hypothetical protein
MSKKKIAEKIRALLAKAESTEHEAEADLFFSRAQELLEKYQITELSLEEDPVVDEVMASYAMTSHVWKRNLYAALCALYGAEAVYIGTVLRKKNGGRTRGYDVHAIGRESAVETVRVMFPWVCSEVTKRAKRAALITGMSQQGQAKRIAAALVARIYEMAPPVPTKSDTSAEGKNALITISAVQALMEQRYPDLTVLKGGRSVTDTVSRREAAGINLDRQVGGGQTKQLTNT